jgi:hypothetical protein
MPISRDFTRLVIVPGHAVYVGRHANDSLDPQHWRGTFPGYRDRDEVTLYAEHVQAGVKHASADSSSLLLFSGGQTREAAGPISEAQGYWCLADQSGWFGEATGKMQASTEEFARDSFENLLFGVYRFRAITARCPQSITVCGFTFKELRYRAHAETVLKFAAALGVDRFAFEYVGVNDPPNYIMDGPKGSREGERLTVSAFSACPLGNSGDLLEKRLGRDPFFRRNPYPICG